MDCDQIYSYDIIIVYIYLSSQTLHVYVTVGYRQRPSERTR